MLIITASGVFTEMQQSLNVIWKAVPPKTTITGLLRARALSLGLVAALGFLLLVSLVISAILTAMSDYISAVIPLGYLILLTLNFVASLALITVLFAAIYKVLPDKPIAWRDVLVGAFATALLFTGGKSVISLYLGSSTIASSYGAAGGLIIALLWVYCSAQIFLLGAEFTKVYAHHHGSRAKQPTDAATESYRALKPNSKVRPEDRTGHRPISAATPRLRPLEGSGEQVRTAARAEMPTFPASSDFARAGVVGYGERAIAVSDPVRRRRTPPPCGRDDRLHDHRAPARHRDAFVCGR